MIHGSIHTFWQQGFAQNNAKRKVWKKAYMFQKQQPETQRLVFQKKTNVSCLTYTIRYLTYNIKYSTYDSAYFIHLMLYIKQGIQNCCFAQQNMLLLLPIFAIRLCGQHRRCGCLAAGPDTRPGRCGRHGLCRRYLAASLRSEQ